MRSQQQVIIIRNEKSMGIAYALWFFFGYLGLHRFYLNRVGSGIAQALLFLAGTATTAIVIGFLPLGVLGVWWICDLFLTARIVRAVNTASPATSLPTALQGE